MKTVKILFGVIVVLLILGMGFGVYVWYTVQKLDTSVGDINVHAPASQATNAVSEPEPTQEPVVIETATLTPTQQTMLTSFGFEGESITITQEMIACAEDAVSEGRLDEILAGAAPTPLEAMKLLPCFK